MGYALCTHNSSFRNFSRVYAKFYGAKNSKLLDNICKKKDVKKILKITFIVLF